MDSHTAAIRSRQPQGVSRIQAAFGPDTPPLRIIEETALNGGGCDSSQDAV